MLKRTAALLCALDQNEVGASALAALFEADRLRPPTAETQTLIARLRSYLVVS